MKSDLYKQVENDVKRVEVPTGQDAPDYWRLRNITVMQQAQRESIAWRVWAILFLLGAVFVLLIAGMGK